MNHFLILIHQSLPR